MAPTLLGPEASKTTAPVRIEVNPETGVADAVPSQREESLKARRAKAAAFSIAMLLGLDALRDDNDANGGVVRLVISAAIGLLLFGATFGIMLTGSENAAAAAENGTTGSPEGDVLLAVVPLVVGISVAMVAFVLIGKVTGVDLV